MSTAETKPRYSPEDLLDMPPGGVYDLVDADPCEVVEGEIYELAGDDGDGKLYRRVRGNFVEHGMGWMASWVGGELHALLRNHCREKNLGWVAPADAPYRFFPEAPKKERWPDVSFVRKGRFPGERPPLRHTLLAPDLAVEVNSPSDPAEDVEWKILEYLRVGVRLIWIVTIQTRTVRIHRADGSVAYLREHDELRGEDVLPGFRCRVGDLFPPRPGDGSRPAVE